jgi:hypothetical protein
MKKMTTSEACLYLAEEWDKAREDEDGLFVASINEWPCHGLCASICTLLHHEAIDDDQWQEMCKAIGKQQRLLNAYCWNRDKAGACARAEFCRKQAAELA